MHFASTLMSDGDPQPFEVGVPAERLVHGLLDCSKNAHVGNDEDPPRNGSKGAKTIYHPIDKDLPRLTARDLHGTPEPPLVQEARPRRLDLSRSQAAYLSGSTLVERAVRSKLR